LLNGLHCAYGATHTNIHHTGSPGCDLSPSGFETMLDVGVATKRPRDSQERTGRAGASCKTRLRLPAFLFGLPQSPLILKTLSTSLSVQPISFFFPGFGWLGVTRRKRSCAHSFYWFGLVAIPLPLKADEAPMPPEGMGDVSAPRNKNIHRLAAQHGRPPGASVEAHVPPARPTRVRVNAVPVADERRADPERRLNHHPRDTLPAGSRRGS